jgi:thioredoxin 1
MIQLIKFGADWCGPCKLIAPTIEKLQSKYNTEGSEIEIISSDVDQNPDLAKTHKIMSIPTILILKNDEVVFRKTGVMQESQIELELTNILNEN